MVFARVIYGINWVNIGAVFFLMAPDLGSGVSGLGTVTAAFYLGLGLLQIPGGLLAARYGPKRVVVYGIFLSSFSVLGTPLSTTVPEVALLRFIAGCGMAFVFAPAVIIISNLLRGGKSGMGVGLLNSAFYVGGIFGLFGWVVLAIFTGWRPSLFLAGAIGVLSGILVAAFVPGDSPASTRRVDRRALLAVVGDRQLILLGFGTMGLGVAYTEITGFMTLYAVNALAVSGVLAGGVTALMTTVPIFTALWGGRAFDKLSNHRTIMAVSLIGGAAALFIGSYPSIYAAALASALGGAVAGVGYTFAFAGARELTRAGKDYESLAVAWVNSISLTGSFLPPIFFSFVVADFGYRTGWLWSGLLTFVFIAPVMLMKKKWSG